jgi:hypothetical protein
MLKAGFDFTVKIEFCYIFVVHLPPKAVFRCCLVLSEIVEKDSGERGVGIISPCILLEDQTNQLQQNLPVSLAQQSLF